MRKTFRYGKHTGSLHGLPAQQFRAGNIDRAVPGTGRCGLARQDNPTSFGRAFGDKGLWLSVKPFAKKYRSDDACIIFDDTIIEKPFSKSDEHNCYHYDHSKGRNVKGINLLNCLYHSETEKGQVRIPINYHLVAKALHCC